MVLNIHLNNWPEDCKCLASQEVAAALMCIGSSSVFLGYEKHLKTIHKKPQLEVQKYANTLHQCILPSKFARSFFFLFHIRICYFSPLNHNINAGLLDCESFIYTQINLSVFLYFVFRYIL